MNAPLFEWPVRVYWEDTDAGGIVYYANYLKFMERARTEWLRSLGLCQSALVQTHGGLFVVTEVRARYIAPARLDDALQVSVQSGERGRASLTLRQQVWRQSGQAPRALLCAAQVRVGWVDAQRLKAQRLPADVLQRLLPPAP